MSVAFAPEGDLLISGSLDQTVRVWRIPDGQQAVVIPAHRQIQSVAISPDGGLLASGCTDGAILLWDMRAARKAAAD